jgi:hypothetical protein
MANTRPEEMLPDDVLQAVAPPHPFTGQPTLYTCPSTRPGCAVHTVCNIILTHTLILSVCRIPNEGARHGRKLILPPAPARHAASGDLWLPHADLVARVAAAGFEYTHEWAEGDYLAALG